MPKEPPPHRESETPATLGRVAYHVAEVAQLTGLGKTTLWAEIREGRLRACRPAARVTLILAADLVSWLERAAQPPDVSMPDALRGRRGR